MSGVKVMIFNFFGSKKKNSTSSESSAETKQEEKFENVSVHKTMLE